jgi:hypothetical protein
LKNIVVFVPKSLSTGIFLSQILQYALEANGRFNFVIYFQSKRDFEVVKKNKLSSSDNICYKVGIKCLFKILTKADYYYMRDIITFSKFYIPLRLLRLRYNSKLIYDFRGLVSEESFYRNNSIMRKLIIRYLEKCIFNYADIINCVSNNLKLYLLKNNNMTKTINVIPCCVSDNVKKKYELKNEINFVYVGSLGPWQMIDETLELFKKIMQGLNKKCTLTIFTSDIDIAIQKVNKYKLDNIYIKGFDFSKDKSLLLNFDFGFLLRNDSLVNHVSSPVKYAEYISNGIIPITTRHIGDFFGPSISNKIIVNATDLNEIGLIIDQIKNCINDKGIHNRLYEFSKSLVWSYHENHLFLNS